MILVHQAGSVRVGEVVRYTVTYTPSLDRILPSPSHLYVRIKNASPVPLRAAYLHGPYTIHVAAYSSNFNPNKKLENLKRDGVPEFEPNLKAGGHWYAKLTVPDNIREKGDRANATRNSDGSISSVQWIIEISSQILFSNTAVVRYELLVSRDHRSLELGFAAIAGKGHGEPGQIADYRRRKQHHRDTLPMGVYSRAIEVAVEDTDDLWNKPALPQWVGEAESTENGGSVDLYKASIDHDEQKRPTRRFKAKKVHLVVLTHGLHSNVGADMLYLKESIDGAARDAREAARERKRHSKRSQGTSSSEDQQNQDPSATAPLTGGQEDMVDEEENSDDSDDELVIVRGFRGNACRTDRGVQYLGKRLAKFVLTTTYPDQPFLPPSKTRTFPSTLLGNNRKRSDKYGLPAHPGSTIRRIDDEERLPYTFTKISFIGHSLGGLVQMYAMAYIHKHSPGFFEKIRPENFVTLASPLLGLSNENPLYIKFALDFGLVGRTGQDLGLTWRAPNLAKTGWSALLSGFGQNQKQEEKGGEMDPTVKPLLRILPTGPAHQVLKMFRNRTLYSNVVNDGIVPLRTSCLLFLDWRGLDKVDNARRENGLIGTMAALGWAELTGANSTSHRPPTASTDGGVAPDESIDVSPHSTPKPQSYGHDIGDFSSHSADNKSSPSSSQFLAVPTPDQESFQANDPTLQASSSQELRSYTLPTNPLTNFINFFRPAPPKEQHEQNRRRSKKAVRTYKRAQTLRVERKESTQDANEIYRIDSLEYEQHAMLPPKTSIFDAASDILNPPLPPTSWLVDPTARDRTIFHDRIYHPEDIPPPAPRTQTRSSIISSTSQGSSGSQTAAASDVSPSMRLEEKIARAYHKDISWRKVLVNLQPDAHNNMVVRRMFANSYGWDVIKHVCDTHFANTYSSNTRDEFESGVDRAKPMHEPVTSDGEEVHGQTSKAAIAPPRQRTTSELREAADEVRALPEAQRKMSALASSNPTIKTTSKITNKASLESLTWTDSAFDDGEEDDDSEEEVGGDSRMNVIQRFWRGDKRNERDIEQEVAHDNNLHLHKSSPESGSASSLPQAAARKDFSGTQATDLSIQGGTTEQ